MFYHRVSNLVQHCQGLWTCRKIGIASHNSTSTPESNSDNIGIKMRFIHFQSNTLMVSNHSCAVVALDKQGETQMMKGEARNPTLLVAINDDSLIQMTGKKKVSFAIHNLETARVIPNCLDSSEEELTGIWNTAAKAFRDSLAAANDTVQYVLREHKEIIECLDDTRNKAEEIARCIRNEETLSTVLTRVDVSSSVCKTRHALCFFGQLLFNST
jgi:hypothetical protein